MLKSSIGIALVVSLVGLAGCASQAEMVGAGTGAALGAAVGGGTMATVGGAMVGYGAGHVYDQKHPCPRPGTKRCRRAGGALRRGAATRTGRSSGGSNLHSAPRLERCYRARWGYWFRASCRRA